MTDSPSPSKRPITLSNAVRGLMALFAVVAIGAAFAEGHIGLGIAGVLFLAVAVPLGYWAWRFRQSSDAASSSRKPL